MGTSLLQTLKYVRIVCSATRTNTQVMCLHLLLILFLILSNPCTSQMATTCQSGGGFCKSVPDIAFRRCPRRAVARDRHTSRLLRSGNVRTARRQAEWLGLLRTPVSTIASPAGADAQITSRDTILMLCNSVLQRLLLFRVVVVVVVRTRALDRFYFRGPLEVRGRGR